MSDILQELMTLAGIPLMEAETPAPQLPNLNLNRQKIIPDDDPAKLRNFRNWFGNSTTGWNGQPMVFYHGTQSQSQGNKQAAFNSFDKTKLGKNSHFSSKVGFFFTSSKMMAEEFGSHVIAVYLRMINPKIYSSGPVSSRDTKLEQGFYDTHKSNDEYAARVPLNAMRAHTDAYDKFVADIYHKNGVMPYTRNSHNSFEDAVDIRGKEGEFIAKYIASLKSEGYDSIIIRNTVADASKNFGSPTTQYCVFDPEQIKSVVNNGEFSLTNSNIYEGVEMKDIEEAAAYAGSRRNYDQPSLDAIGSGEGEQAHGWGLYYALNPDIAETYRKTFTENPYENVWELLGEDLTEFLGELLNTDTRYMLEKVFDKEQTPDTSSARDNLLIALYDVYQFYATRYRNQHNQRDKELAEEALEKRDYVATLRQDDFSVGVGVVHKVEIPDLKFLMDEKEMMREQSDYVRLRIASIVKDVIPDLKTVYFTISGKEFYNILSDKLGSPKKASFLLHKYGIKGIHYFGEQDGECVVIFNPEDLRVLKKFYGGKGIEMEKIGGRFNQN